MGASEYRATDYALDDPRVCVRMRVNKDRDEAWCAAMRLGTGVEPAAVTLRMPRPRGRVINLATNEQIAVETGLLRIPLTADAAPLFFCTGVTKGPSMMIAWIPAPFRLAAACVSGVLAVAGWSHAAETTPPAAGPQIPGLAWQQ